MKEIALGLVGIGTVGGGVVKVLHKQTEKIRNELGLPIRLARIVDKATERFSELPVGDATCTTDIQDILRDDAIDVVIELVGGTGFAKEVVLAALSRKKHVITANKALIATCGPEIFECAARNGVSVYFEAAVGGGMPVIKAIREGLVGNDIFSVKTIINGTCNYILTKMTDQAVDFDIVLKEAQANGYAETDPTLDINGGDAGHKVAILASLVSGGYVPYNAITIEGITAIGKEDIAYAKELGYTIKLLGIIKKDSAGKEIDVRVHPAMLPNAHILASVSNVYNAVLLEGDSVGQILIYGRGAGELPTASAVVSDIVDVARNITTNGPVRIPMSYYTTHHAVRIKSFESIVTRYYLRFLVFDRPGVFASITSYLGAEGISIASVIQKEGSVDNTVPVIMLTHEATEKGIRTALANIEKMDYIKDKTHIIRIED